MGLYKWAQGLTASLESNLGGKVGGREELFTVETTIFQQEVLDGPSKDAFGRINVEPGRMKPHFGRVKPP